MANTAALTKNVYPYVLKEVSEKLGIQLVEKKLLIGNPLKEKKFDGVSIDNKTILSIFTSSGFSVSGKNPVGKINALYACCFLMNQTQAQRKILAFTNEEFMNIITNKSKPFLSDFELIYIPLTEELKRLSEDVSKDASKEMS
jgi:hypothetical protein